MRVFEDYCYRVEQRMKKLDEIHSSLLDTAKLSCPQLKEVINRNGVLKLSKPKGRGKSLFSFLVRTVVGQQLSKAAAETIYQRLLSKCNEDEEAMFGLFVRKRKRTLLSCGLSKTKAEALCRLREAFESGAIDEKRLKKSSPSEINEQISSLWGFGKWSADIVAMFYVNHPDIWPDGDGAIVRGLKLLEVEEQDELVESFAPYRSFLALHIWKGLDSGVISSKSQS